ncbi:MAG TPA: cytochrome P450 [Ktedonobacterales bacterium]|nr:cytochrome P450 [Ktedonobacterales bacterium]
MDHSAFFQKKTATAAEPADLPDVEQDADGTWHIRAFQEARAILRGGDTKQAGFRAELVERLSGEGNIPILYQEGKTHQQQRKQTARFFTPKAVSSDYRQLMESVADELIAELRRDKRADLSALSLALAVRVAAAVVGLTNSRRPGMPKRLEAFFTVDAGGEAHDWRQALAHIWHTARSQLHFLAFFYLDVKPAIEARKRQPTEDVISHLLALGYRDREILTECVTYGAAGMVTTREFISVATWHLLEQPTLRARYLAAPEAERLALLEEILRLEPVVGHLYRRATKDIHLTVGAESVTIPQGALLDLHIHAANTDERVTGEYPFAIRPNRELHGERVGAAMLSFGDGAHRCPGSYIALQETDIFLRRLLALEGLRMEGPPTLTWNALVTGYELRDFPISVA